MNIALKEWASVVAALDAGLQICLLRKGGIVEADRGGFQLRYQRFLLFPTHEHQHGLLLQEPFKHLAVEPRNDDHELSLLCEVTDLASVTADLRSLEAAGDHFIWNGAFLRKRLEYKPDLPLYAILVRALRLPSTIQIPDRSSYRGCKSWVHLTEEIDVSCGQPVLTDDEYTSRREALTSALGLEFKHGDLAIR